MANVRTILDKVWAELRQVNVVDDLAIIEYIAALLVEEKMEIEGSTWPFDEQLRPQRPRVRYNPGDDGLKSQLRSAMRELPTQHDKVVTLPFNEYTSESIARLFDQHVLFFPSRYPENGAYPTPRHIIDFMLNILQIKPEHSFADFACGSGGFLIRRVQQQISIVKTKRKGETLGIDIAVEWIRIALANIFFHNQQNDMKTQTGSAFSILNEQGKQAEYTFDRIALSPPLDTIVADEPDRQQLFVKMSVSDTAFTSRVIKHLKPTGKGTIIVSSSFVTFNEEEDYDRDTYNIREQLVKKQMLRAVITQKNGLFHRSTPAHILYIDKSPHKQLDFVWLCLAERDGYRSKQQHVLSQNPALEPGENDLPFLQKIIHITGKNNEFDTSNISESKPFWQKKIFQKDTFLGIVLKPRPGIKIQEINYCWLDEIPYTSGTPYISIEVRERGESIDHMGPIYKVSLDRYPLRDQGHPSFDRLERSIFANSTEGQLIAISADGSLLGITKTLAEISARSDYNLLPHYYFDQHSPQVLSSLAKKTIVKDKLQTEMSEVNEIYIEEKPLPQISHHTSALLQLLNIKQRTIWQFIEQVYSRDKYAIHFTPEQFQRSFKQSDVMSTLELLEHMGLIRRVTLTGTQGQPSRQWYRRMIETEIITEQTRETTIKTEWS